jgi:hypothetical protein
MATNAKGMKPTAGKSPKAAQKSAHASGHRKLNLEADDSKVHGKKSKFENASAEDQMSPSEKIRRVEVNQRRS